MVAVQHPAGLHGGRRRRLRVAVCPGAATYLTDGSSVAGRGARVGTPTTWLSAAGKACPWSTLQSGGKTGAGKRGGGGPHPRGCRPPAAPHAGTTATTASRVVAPTVPASAVGTPSAGRAYAVIPTVTGVVGKREATLQRPLPTPASPAGGCRWGPGPNGSRCQRRAVGAQRGRHDPHGGGGGRKGRKQGRRDGGRGEKSAAEVGWSAEEPHRGKKVDQGRSTMRSYSKRRGQEGENGPSWASDDPKRDPCFF